MSKSWDTLSNFNPTKSGCQELFVFQNIAGNKQEVHFYHLFEERCGSVQFLTHTIITQL